MTSFTILIGIAGLSLGSLIVLFFLIIQTYKTEKIPSIKQVAYEQIAPSDRTASDNQRNFRDIENDINTAYKLPQTVANFLGTHQKFDFAALIKDVEYNQKQAFLDNLALIIQKAQAKHLSDQQLGELVEEFASTWKRYNFRKGDPQARERSRAVYIETAVGVFGTLTVLCLILVLLAIERHTRISAQKLSL